MNQDLCMDTAKAISRVKILFKMLVYLVYKPHLFKDFFHICNSFAIDARALCKIRRGIFLSLCAVLVTACANPYKTDSAPKKKPPTRVDRSEKVIPRAEPKSKYGNPTSYVVLGRRYFVLPSAAGYVEQGIASWYGTKFHGRRTSSGETYDMYAMTAAHKTLPLPTYARVTNKRNGRSIIVRINDRGPFHKNRLIDLSYSAATKLGIVTRGTGLVEVRAIDPRTYKERPSKGKLVDVAAPEKETTQSTNEKETLQAATEKKVEIYVQLGAFRMRQNAQKLKSQFAALNVGNVSVHSGELDGTPIYRVRIGPLDTVAQADKTVEKLNRLGHKDYKLIFED